MRKENCVESRVEFQVPFCEERCLVCSFIHSYDLVRPMASWKIAKSGLNSSVGPGLWLYQGLQSPLISTPSYPEEQCFVGFQIHRELKYGCFGRRPGDGMTIISNLFSEKSELRE
jgi:hypothetical protein